MRSLEALEQVVTGAIGGTGRRRSEDRTEPLRDGFAVSRLFRLRRIVRRHPFGFLLFFLPIVLGWTILLSYGASVYGSNAFIIQYSPSIGFYSLIIGLAIYPPQRFWIPALTFVAVLFVPFCLPFVDLSDWYGLLQTAPHVVVIIFAMNVTTAILNGAIAMWVFGLFRAKMSPYSADMVLAFAGQVAFLILNLCMIFGFDRFMSAQSDVTQAFAGYDSHYVDLAIRRVLRGCAVFLVFILLFFNRPRWKDAYYIALPVAVYAVMTVLYLMGYGSPSGIEAGIVGCMFALLLPSNAATLALVVSVGLYASATGVYLSDVVYASPDEGVLEYYAIALLNLAAIILAKSGAQHERETSAVDSITRLDVARDFAGVGIFVVNQSTGVIQLDHTSMRVTGIPRVFSNVADVYSRFAPESQKELIAVGVVEPGTSFNRILRVPRDDGDDVMIRIFVWAQRSESGANLAYGLVVDITEAYKQESALRHALTDLEAKDEKQRRMFSIISHEIRTPASVLSMLIEDLDHANLDETRSRMEEASDQLLGVLTDMRQAVNPAQNMAIVKSSYLPAQLAETVRNTYQDLAHKSSMRIELHLGAGANVRRVGDQTRAKQLIGNLVRNALIHSKGTKVEIYFEERKEATGETWTQWTIRDDGVGVPKDEVPRLFEPFERGGTDPRNQADGSGLGLYIAKTTVELLGGAIVYVPIPKGACYAISLPEPIAADQSAPQPAKKSLSMAHTSKMNVLLAEDNALVAEVTKSRLSKLFKSVTVASDGQLALDHMENHSPDLLITDLFMPKLEGDELIKRLREKGHDFPIIGLTAAAVGNDIDRFQAAGADLVMAKPLDMERLMAFLARLAD